MEQPTGTPTTPAGVVAAAGAAIHPLGEVLWAAKTSEELVGTVEQIESLRAQLAGLEASVLAEVQARQVPKKELAWGSTADWFTHLAGTTRSEGHRTVQHAPILVGERTATHAAMLAGRVSPEQAAVIVAAVEKLPLDAGVRDHAEAVLLEEAARLNATDLGHGRQAPGRGGRPGQGGAGRREGAGPGGPGRAPRPVPVHHRGRRRRRPAPGPRHRRGRRPPQGRAAAADQAAAGRGRRRPGLRGRCTTRATTAPGCGTPSSRPAEHALATDLPPDCHGARPRVTVTTALDVLRQQIDWATLGTSVVDHRRRPRARPRRWSGGWPATPTSSPSPSAARVRSSTSAACTGWSPRRSGEPSSAATSTAPSPAAPDPRSCATPTTSSTGPAGGETKLDNLVLLCGQHHRVIHHTPWEVRINPDDGRPEFLPPPKTGHPPPDWIRSRPRRE